MLRRSALSGLNQAFRTSFAASSLAPFSRNYADTTKSITVEVNPFATHKIEAPSTFVTTNVGELTEYFTRLYRMRRMETAADMLYKSKLIRGFLHLEAVIVGLEAAASQADSIITSYRDHCHLLGRGGSVYSCVAELMGKADGASKGMGGSMHMYNKEHNFYGGQGIVGAQVPLGTGLAWYHQYKGDGSVAFAMYGDGAANQGQVFEAFNIAGLWKLPIIFICENNHYGMGTAEHRAAKSHTYYTRGDYIPGIKANGMDVLSVRQVVEYAKKFVLENGPLVLELDTYRYHGHSMSDPGSSYRNRDEIWTVRNQRDPVEQVRHMLVELGGVNPADLKQIEKDVKKEVDTAIEAAKKAAPPPADWLTHNIYKAPLGASIRGVRPNQWIAVS